MKTRPAGSSPSHAVATSSLVKSGPLRLQQRERDQRVVHVVVLGHPVDVLDQAGGPAGPVPRPAGGHLVGQPDRGEVAAERPPAGGFEDLPDPGPRDLLHRLAEQAPGGPAEPGAVHPVADRADGRQRHAIVQPQAPDRLAGRPARRRWPAPGAGRSRRAAPRPARAARPGPAAPTRHRPEAGPGRRRRPTAPRCRRPARPLRGWRSVRAGSRSSGCTQVTLMTRRAAADGGPIGVSARRLASAIAR